MYKPAFPTLDSVAIPLDRRNVDTDQIIPARFLRKPRAAGMADYLFHDLRRGEDGRLRADFVVNDSRYAGAAVLISRENFGSGSSREAAVYALWDYGFRAVIAPSFGDIFFSNSLKNGLLPVVLDTSSVERLLTGLSSLPGGRVQVDLGDQTVTAPDGARYPFDIDPFQKQLLLSGQDELGYTLALAPKIDLFESTRAGREPWV
ncbi:MAG: 3-isopropylmalate dehydratase small subunit [Betaproteobacteria bacterium]